MRLGGRIGKGRLEVVTDGLGLRTISFAGHKVLRALTWPVRDANWGTMPVRAEHEEIGNDRYRLRFSGPDSLFSGQFDLSLPDEQTLVATLALSFSTDAMINRAGFTLLHPIRGVAGEPLTIRHPDGSTDDSHFPRQIAPAQPALEIAGIEHRVGLVAVRIDLEGEVFEMEDQRNWSDASFKTYCRPLSRPAPYPVAMGEDVWQRVTISLASDEPSVAAPERDETETDAILPQVMLAWEQGLCSLGGIASAARLPLLARIDLATDAAAIAALAAHGRVAVEIVYDDLPDLDRQIARIRASGLRPMRLAALPRSYLRSYQPAGPWPEGPTPDTALAPLKAAFPDTAVGAGSLTNFTELNRWPPRVRSDFLTFGNTANVHAADDRSVMQTLEALPDIFASAKALSPGLPLHLGLFAIAMRTNPYGATVQPNPDRLRLPMVQDDPRQGTEFAAAYAAAILALAAEAGVESVALAMTDGPLGPGNGPLADFLVHAADLAGHPVRLRRDRQFYEVRAQDGRGFRAETLIADDPGPALTMLRCDP